MARDTAGLCYQGILQGKLVENVTNTVPVDAPAQNPRMP